MAILDSVLEDNENKKIEVDTGKALTGTLNTETKLENKVDGEEDKKEGAISKFLKDFSIGKGVGKIIENVGGSIGNFANFTGSALVNMAEVLPKKLDQIYEDPKKRANLIRGLFTIAESSGYDPEFKSPLGKFAKGQLKGEQFLSAEKAEAANTASKAQTNLLKQLEIQANLNKPTGVEQDLYKDLRDRNKDVTRAANVLPIYNQMKKLVREQFDKGETLKTGVILGQIPGATQAILDLIPENIRPKDSFLLEKISDAAETNKRIEQLNDQIIVNELSKFVPVSDKDILVAKRKEPGTGQTQGALVKTLRQNDALATLNAGKANSIEEFTRARGYADPKGASFEEYFLTTGATKLRDDLLKNSGYSPDTLFNEAKKLGYSADYGKYVDKKDTFSPFALAEAKASLDLGGVDKYNPIIRKSGIGSTDSGVTRTSSGDIINKPSIMNTPNLNDVIEKQKRK
jgi:hypothetical protein